MNISQPKLRSEKVDDDDGGGGGGGDDDDDDDNVGDTTNVEPEMYNYTSNKWSHWNSNEKLKEKFGSCTRKTFDRFTTKDSYIGTSHIIQKVLQCEA